MLSVARYRVGEIRSFGGLDMMDWLDDIVVSQGTFERPERPSDSEDGRRELEPVFLGGSARSSDGPHDMASGVLPATLTSSTVPSSKRFGVRQMLPLVLHALLPTPKPEAKVREGLAEFMWSRVGERRLLPYEYISL